MTMHFHEPVFASVLISSVLYNPGITNEAYCRLRIALAKADVTRSKGDRHKEIDRWVDILNMHKQEEEGYRDH